VTGRAAFDIIAVEFAAVDTNALASIVLAADSSLLFKDFPAVHQAAENSTWRVDDGGVFSAESLDILFVAPTSAGYLMATVWAGAEGDACELSVADSAASFRSLAKGYRYRSPI
jgi:hypothetical protein